jgi:general secretion pathway protein E/type IV pilus assembly protein PilB
MIENGHIELSTELQQLLTPEQAWHYSIIPKYTNIATLGLYIDGDKQNGHEKDELEILFGKKIELFPIDGHVLRKTLSKYYRKSEKQNKRGRQVDSIKRSDDFLTNLIYEASEIESSDIHLEPYEEQCRVRMRIDGKLVERYILKKKDYPALVNKVKIKSNLDIAEKRLPQDGRIFFNNNGEHFDIRVSVLPTLHGEKVVLRLLGKDAAQIDIGQLGMSRYQMNIFLEAVKKPHGIILISGPTGSGKTTTLYATLKILNNELTNILTIEDPIEYTLEGINQVQLKESIGLTFASALRTFLRQDPDIIMLGEIRDGETAQMAVRAALTGHLVLSTIHTNSAWGTISRLIDMEVPPFLLANTINLSAAQRLVRLLCPECKKKESFDPSMFPKNFKPSYQIIDHYIPVGCESCYYTGYKGRSAVYEIIPLDEELSEAIKEKRLDYHGFMKEKNNQTLADQAMRLFENGETSIEEIYNILMNNF